MSGITGFINLNGSIKSCSNYEILEKEFKKRGEYFSCLRSEANNFLFLNASHNKTIRLFKKNGSYGEFIVNFDGRIDNREDIIQQLSLSDNIEDAELLLAAYFKLGNKVTDCIVGPFSFVIFDCIKSTIFCGRDHLGMRPFFYAYIDGFFVYSSEPKFIFLLSDIEKKLNKERFHDYILDNQENDHLTLYENIFRLNRGENLFISNGSLKINTYHKFQKPEYIELGSDLEYSELFENLFEGIIKSQLQRIDNIGSTISGGLDSTSVSRMIAFINDKYGFDKKFYSYTYSFNNLKDHDEAKVNELSYVYDAVKMGGINLKKVNLSDTNVIESLLLDQVKFSEPCTHGNRYQELALIKELKKDGISTIFTGFDGDCTVSYGLEQIQLLLNSGNFIEAIKQNKLQRTLRGSTDNTLSMITTYFFIKNLPVMMHFLIKKFKGLKNFSPQHKFLRNDVRKDINYLDALRERRELMFNTELGHSRLLNSKSFTKIFEMLDVDYTYNGIQEIHPFCDKRLMELCLRIPPAQKFQNGYTRAILRNSMKKHLPESIRKRGDKANLSPYFFYSFDKLKPKLIEELIDCNQHLSEYIDKEYIKGLSKGDITGEEKTLIVNYNVINSWLNANNL